MKVTQIIKREISQIQKNSQDPQWANKKAQEYKKVLEVAGKKLGITNPMQQVLNVAKKKRQWTTRDVANLTKIFLRDGAYETLSKLGFRFQTRKQASLLKYLGRGALYVGKGVGKGIGRGALAIGRGIRRGVFSIAISVFFAAMCGLLLLLLGPFAFPVMDDLHRELYDLREKTTR